MIEDVTVAIKNMDLMIHDGFMRIPLQYITIKKKTIFHISHDIPMTHSYGNPI